jgi:tetratricopeptide (TPR) repeat protein
VPPPPAAEVIANPQAGVVQPGGKLTAFEAGQVAGSVNVVLPTYGTPARAPRIQVPPGVRGAFFGRAETLADVAAAVRKRQPTLLHGVGGIGKTALAAAAAERLHAERVFDGGVQWVSEIGRAPLAAVCDAIARQLGDEEVPKLPPPDKPDAVRGLLAGRPDLLLVLDSLRGDATARDFLEKCLPPNGGALLATSRARDPAFENDFPVGPLRRDDAVKLFCNRAKLGPAGDLAKETRDLVEEVCDLLDDHPLALVIAAGRVRTEGMPLASLRERLADEKKRLPALDVGDGSDKSQSVRASLRISYDDLRPEQQHAFVSLAACFGRTTGLGVLAEVLGTPVSDCEDLIGRLVSQSLVERDGDRVGLQRLVRDFGRHALGNSRLEEVQDRVLVVMGGYASKHKQNTPEGYDRLEAEIDNLLGALRHAGERKNWAVALPLARTLGLPISGVLAVRGYWEELTAVSKLGVEAANQAGDRQALADLTLCAAIILHRQGDYDQARGFYQAALATSTELQDHTNVSKTLHNLGMLAQSQGRYEEARRLYTESLKIKKEQLEDEGGAARTLHELGRLAHNQGNFEEARRLFEESLALKRELNDEVGIATTQYNVGRTHQDQGNYEAALPLFEELLQVSTKRGDLQGIAIARYHFGRFAQDQGRYEEAEDLYQKSLQAFKDLGARTYVAGALHDLGRLAQERGNPANARDCYERSRAIREKLGDRAGIADVLCQLGLLARDEGDRETARRHLEESAKIFTELPDWAGVARTRHELGRLAYERGERNDADRLYRQSLELSGRLGIQGVVARNLRRLGDLARDEGKAAEAGGLYRRALEIFDRLRWPQAEAVRRDLAGPGEGPK